MNIVKRGIFFLRQNGPSALIRHIIAHPKYRLELFKAKSTILFKNNKIKVVDKDKRIRIKQNGVIVNFKIQDDPQNTFGLVFENFLYEQYKQLDAYGESIIDIGASIADTALYFAAKGAKRVYGYEISQNRQQEARINLGINPKLSKKIIYINEGINVHKLNTIVSSLKDCSIKIDCDNAKLESELIRGLKKSGNLDRVNELIIEYSEGYEPINKTLVDSGFDVRITPNSAFGNSGILFAKHR